MEALDWFLHVSIPWSQTLQIGSQLDWFVVEKCSQIDSGVEQQQPQQSHSCAIAAPSKGSSSSNDMIALVETLAHRRNVKNWLTECLA